MSDSKFQPITILSSLKSQPLLSERLKIIIEILIVYNCRIKEILNLSRRDIYPHQFIIIRGLKKSADIVIRDREILTRIENLKENGSDFVFFPVKYKFVYDFLKRNYSHLFKNIIIKKNMKITHAPRYLNAAPLGNDKDIELILHHRSQRSSKYYKNKVKIK